MARLKLHTRPAITRYGRVEELTLRVLARVLSMPDSRITGSTGRMHGEIPVISPPRNPIRAMVCTATRRGSMDTGR